MVVGATAWGTTLAIHLARNGQPTTLLARTPEEAAALAAGRTNMGHLAGVPFPESLAVAGTPEAVAEADLLCLVVPSRTLAANVSAVAASVAADAVVLSAVKGLEQGTGRRMTEVIEDGLPGRPLAVLSGPNLSREVAEGLPGSTVIASAHGQRDQLRGAFHSSSLRVYTSTDTVGVEMGGALKNVMAIAAGIVDALGFGNNAKAAILTRGLAEITRLGVAAGADPLTFQGLAGMGDLVATSYSPLSRNRRLGELIGSGSGVADALTAIGETAEGATTIEAARALAARLGVDTPITDGLHRVLYEGLHPLRAMEALMARDPREER